MEILRNDFLRFTFASIGATIDTTKGYLGGAENIMSICMLKPHVRRFGIALTPLKYKTTRTGIRRTRRF